MSIDYLKTNSEEVYRVLDDIIVGGFKLRDKLIQDNGKIDGVPSSEMIMEWRKDYAYWYERSVTHLKNIYKSERQSLTFLHKSGTQLNVPGRHQECTDIICKIDVKIILIEEYIKLLENRFPIVFKAMRDNNIQIGGENNKQTVSNSTRKEMEKEPLIKISKGGDNFKMIDCEVVSGNRPALKTEALNTELIRTTLSQNTSTPEKDAELKQFSSWWKKPEFVIPTVIALVSVPWWPQILESLGF